MRQQGVDTLENSCKAANKLVDVGQHEVHALNSLAGDITAIAGAFFQQQQKRFKHMHKQGG